MKTKIRLIACGLSAAALTLAATLLTRQAEAADTESDVTAVLSKQAEAWNNADLDAFMTGYLRSPETSYTSSGEEVWGYDALLQRYQKRYGTSRDTMGKLTFSDLKTFSLGPKNALCIGHWHVELAAKPALQGTFSLVLTKTASGWKILHDHTSALAKKTE